MDQVLLARIQFAFTVGFHYIFPPITIGIAWIIAWMLYRHLKTGDEDLFEASHFWLKLFAINFAVGVATGITMEFQFGTNWSEYSRYVGDIFGAPLAAEAIFAFFLESTFMGVMIFGWKRFSRKTLWFSSLMVALGSSLSGFWIIVANSWMQTPTGYKMEGGHAVLTDFFAAVFNPSTLPRYLHTISAALVTGGFFVLGIAALLIMKRKSLAIAKKSFVIALITIAIFAVVQAGIGHWHAIEVLEQQPLKLAAVEGLFETQKGAPALVFGMPDAKAEKVHAEIKIPKLLSLLGTGNPDAEIKGLKSFPKENWPPLGLTFYPFHLMVLLGGYFIALAFLGLYLLWKKRLFESSWFLKLAFWSLPLPILANELGWMTAEVGRQPWAVYNVLKTSDAVSISVPGWQILLSLLLFVVVYALLFYAWFRLIRREINNAPDEPMTKEVAA